MPAWTPSTRTRSSIADLVVERHQLVDPRLVDVGAEEVVEEAVRAVGRQRDHRPDRDVRTARERCSRRGSARGSGTGCAAAHRRGASACRRPRGSGRAGSRAGRRSTARTTRPTRRASARAADARPGSGSTRGSSRRRSSSSPRARSPSACRSGACRRRGRARRPEPASSRAPRRAAPDPRCVFTNTNGPQVSTRGATEAELALREARLLVRARRGAQRAVEAVRPRVVRALERLALALALGDLEAAVAADVEKRAHLAVLRAGHDDRRAAGLRREERARLRKLPEVADVLPGRAEDALLLAAQDLRIRVPAVGERRLHVRL